MNICLLGDFSANLDEGFKNTGYYLAKELETNHTVTRLNIKQLKTAAFWRETLTARPNIIHTLAQPTLGSLMFTRLLGYLWPQARTVVSALRPESLLAEGQTHQSRRRLTSLTRPDLILVQTSPAEAQFRQWGWSVKWLPNGVDLERFRPVTPERKQQLRLQYGLPLHQPIVLHVGHLESARNLLALADLSQAQIQVVIAGSLYMGIQHELIAQLEKAGFRVFKGYCPQVEDLYMLADGYVFPLQPGHSLNMPLSVLEAMACNLPVITTRFGGLVHAFQEGPGFKFVDPTGPFLPHVQELLASPIPSATRQMVSTYSWPAVVQQLERYYEELWQ